MMLLLWGLVIAGIVWLVKTVSGGSGGSAAGGDGRSRAILAERFARGEISADEFRRMRDELH